MRKTKETTLQKAFRLVAEVNDPDMDITDMRSDSIVTWLYNNGYIMRPHQGTLKLMDRWTREFIEDK